MALNGSHAAALRPSVASEGFPSHPLSSSISSLASSSSRHSSSHVSKTYRQASSLFLTRRLPEALSTVLPLITPPPPPPDQPSGLVEPAPVARASRTTRVKVWSLYLTILNAVVELDPDEGKDAFGTQEWRGICSKVRDGDVWEEVVQNGYHGVEGDVDSEVIINLATLLLAHARTQILNQKRLENYLAASSTPNLDVSSRLAQSASPRLRSRHRSPSNARSGADTPRDLNARVKILELYTLHVLLRNDEWEYAREFITVSSVLDDERREAFLQALQSLQEDKEAAERQEREERQRREEELRREVEESRKLRADNEERERKRLDAERARRSGSEVDYGIEKAPSAAGSSKGRGGRSQPRAARAPGSPSETHVSRAKPKAAAPSTSLGGRAAVVLSNLGALVERLGASFRSNPMLLVRLLAFIMGLVLMFGKRSARERVSRALGTSWQKVRATAGMGVKVSYI